MKRNKINIDRKPITSEEIAQGRDFKAVLQGAKTVQKPLYKSQWFIANSIIIALVIGASLFFFSQEETANVPETIPFVNPPLKDAQIGMTEYKISSQELTKLTHISGTTIDIPANAFVDAEGNAVTDSVIIQYREFHDQVDIFLSGIPMNYDSAGTEYILESAGMLEIRGFLNGEEVAMAEGKSLQVNLASRIGGSDFNVYELDTSAQNWVYKGKDSITPIAIETPLMDSVVEDNTPKEVARIERKLETVQKEIAQLQKSEPQKPGKVNDQNWNFNISVDPKEFPELSAYKNTMWEVDESKKKFDPKHANIMWEDVIISKQDGDSFYEISFVKRKQKISYIASPVFQGDDYEKAQAVFAQKHKEYSKKLKERKQKESDLAAELKRKREAWEAQQAIVREQQRQQEQRNRVAQTANDVIRSFQVNNFGFWNCDRPLNFARIIKQDMRFKDNQQNDLNLSKAYVVNDKQNTVVLYYKNFTKKDEGLEVQYSKEGHNMVWTITDDEKFAVIPYSEFTSKIANQPSKSDVAMQVLDIKITSGDQLRKLMANDWDVSQLVN